MPLGAFEALSLSAGRGASGSAVPGLRLSLALHAVAVAGLALLPVVSVSELPRVERRDARPVSLPAFVERPRARATPGARPAARAGARFARPASREVPAGETPTAAVSDPPSTGEGVLGEVEPIPPGFGSGSDFGRLGIGVGEGAPPAASQTVRAAVDVAPPRRLSGEPPAFPDLARVARVSGPVVVECTIGTSGRVENLRVVSGHPLLARAAKDAIAGWVYSPTLLNGVPVAVLMTVTIDFQLR